MIGDKIHHYRIVEKLGSGGMGVVYRAIDERLDRQVALKFLPPSRRDDVARERLLQEALAASALEHPNICTIYEISESAEGDPFIAMAFYAGETLDERLERAEGRPLAHEVALSIARQVADGLAEAHRCEIVHCDVKPANLLITDNDKVKILDFGVAKLPGPRARSALGTMPYMSPEQLSRQAIDRRTDIWSLGVVLYQMATGERPFRARDREALKAVILQEEPEPTLRYDAPQNMRLRQILRWCLAKDPEDRYRHAAELLADLESEVDSAPRGPGLIGDPAAQRPAPATRTPVPADSADARIDQRALGGASRPRVPTVVVETFRDLSRDSDQAHLCYGLAEELIARLTPREGLRIATRTPTGVDLALRHPSADFLLQGSVRTSHDRVRVTARLVLAEDDTILWSATYDRRLDSLFDIQDELAERIVEALEAPLATPNRQPLERSDLPPPRRAGSFEAQNLYLKGRHCWMRRSEPEMRRAIDYFQMALAREPGFARARAGVADAYAMLGAYGMAPPMRVMPRAKQAAMEALEHDPKSAEALTSLGCVLSCYDWDLEAAAEAFERALMIDPHYPLGYQWHAMNVLVPRLQFEKALDQLSRAAELDPLSLPVQTCLGLLFSYAGRDEQAERELRRVVEADDQFSLARYSLARLLARIGDDREALEIGTIGAKMEPGRPEALVTLAMVHAAAGRLERASSLLDRLPELSNRHYVPPTLLAQAYAILDYQDLAIASLERAVKVRAADLIWIGVEPAFQGLVDVDAFRRVLQTIGLPATSLAVRTVG
ncbi:MAG: protein kinase [Acidobacteriota bacterium]